MRKDLASLDIVQFRKVILKIASRILLIDFVIVTTTGRPIALGQGFLLLTGRWDSKIRVILNDM